ncbi:MAG: hypothetical protein J1E42_06395 [Akkermansiaceae bacterium]|nr:hypothetical protein [Akkermansiaceae bacterium]
MKKWMAILLGMLVSVCWAAPGQVTEAGRSAVGAARSYGAAVRSCDMGWALDYMYPPIKKAYAERYSSRTGDEATRVRITMGLIKETPEQARARMDAALKALRDHYVNMGRQLAASGVKIESFSVREPVAEYVVTPPTTVAKTVQRDQRGEMQVDQIQNGVERSRLVVLPITLVVSTPGTRGEGPRRVERRSHIFAIRDERVNGPVSRAGLTKRETKINQWYFVDANTDVNLLRTFFPNLPQNIILPDGGERVLR